MSTFRDALSRLSSSFGFLTAFLYLNPAEMSFSFMSNFGLGVSEPMLVLFVAESLY